MATIRSFKGCDMARGFNPIVGVRPKVLILGSFPGSKSLETNQYYSNRRNSFWPIVCNLFDIGLGLPYKERCKQLADSGVAVWDVLESVERQGSSDTNIDTSTAFPNDFITFLLEHGEIRHIFFNGGEAERLFYKLVMSGQRLSTPTKLKA